MLPVALQADRIAKQALRHPAHAGPVLIRPIITNYHKTFACFLKICLINDIY